MGKKKNHKSNKNRYSDSKLHIQKQSTEKEPKIKKSLDDAIKLDHDIPESRCLEESVETDKGFELYATDESNLSETLTELEINLKSNTEQNTSPKMSDVDVKIPNSVNKAISSSSDELGSSELTKESCSTKDKANKTKKNKKSSNDPMIESRNQKHNFITRILEKANKRNIPLIKLFRIICMIGFVVFTGLYLNEVFLQPYLAAKASDKAKTLYQMPVMIPTATIDQTNQGEIVDTTSKVERTDEGEILIIPDPNRDEMGRLLSFSPLLAENPDVKGWIQLLNLNGENDTKIDYVVVQSDPSDPEYYLTRDWLGNKVKSGSLFLDVRSSVERKTKNLVIHGHNMTSTDDMFHYLLKYNEREFYNEHPIINFNTIYETGQWKIFAIFKTNGTSEKEELFDYTVSEFKSDEEFINFIYQLRIRSIYDIDAVDVNEDDQILTLSTCSYEVKNYRTVIVARKVREGEDPTVDTTNVYENPNPLYPYSYYYRYGGKAPKLPATFEEAYEKGMIYWYYKAVDGEEATDRPKREVIPEEEKAKEEKETKKDKEDSTEETPGDTTEIKETKKEIKKDSKKDTKKDNKKDTKKDTTQKEPDIDIRDNTDSELNGEGSKETEPSSTDSNQDKSQDSPTPEVTPTTIPEDIVEANPEDQDIKNPEEAQEPLAVFE